MTPSGNIVLCGLNARYVHTNLALRYLKTYARQNWATAPEIVLLEWTINDQVLPIVRRLYQQNASIYAFSCYIWNVGMIRSICSQLKKVLPGAMIVWGGPEVSYDAASRLQNEPAVDAIIRGEGECAFLALLQQVDLTDRKNLSKVPGLTWKNHTTGTIENNPDGPLLDAAAWTFPYQASDFADLKNRIIYYETSRGCPFRCSYCLSSLDRSVRHRPLGLVFAELDQLLAAGLKQVKLVDRTFNCQPERARQIWQYIIDRHTGAEKTNFHFEVAADLLDDASVELLNQAPPGLIQLEIGVQTTNLDTLRIINRPARLDQLKRQVERLRRGGRIHLHLDLIAGLPGESLSQFSESLDWVLALQPHQLQLGFLKVLPGSPMLQLAAKRGFRWQDEPPYEILQSDAMRFDDLIHLKNIEHLLDIYYNSGLFARSLSWLSGRWSRPYQFWADLAAWTEKQAFMERNFSVEERSRILWQFSIEQLPGLAANPVLQNHWLDLIRFDYVMSGQKDQPVWMNFWENKTDPGSKALLQKARQEFRLRHPDCRRYRLDYFSFDLSKLSETGELVSGGSVMSFDFFGSVPTLLDNHLTNDLY